jgi:hypothetical protein
LPDEVSWPDWRGEIVVVVATGPSAKDVQVSEGRGKAKFLAVKDAARLDYLCPWADALYACDHHWWEAHRGLVSFSGVRMAYDPRTIEKWRGMKFLKVDIRQAHRAFTFDRVGLVGSGGNSGFHAVNLAAQFGARRIVLVGFDMRVDQGKHCFGKHPYSDAPSQANVLRWTGIFDKQASVLANRGIEVVNCSRVSALTAFPKMSFEEALA